MTELRLENHEVRAITARDAPAIQAMFEADPAYFELAEGEPPGPDEGKNLLIGLPEGMDYGDKFDYGVFTPSGALAAVADLVRGYPKPDTWFLGLIFVAVPFRDRGLGAKLLHAIMDHVRASGGKFLRLAVVEGNDGAMRFYGRFGFRLDVTKDRTGSSGKRMKVFVLERAV